jgi:hypothetical protein
VPDAVEAYVSSCSDRETGSGPGRAEFRKRNPVPPEPERSFGSELGSKVPRDGGSGLTAERREGTSAPLRRDGGPIGASAGNGRGLLREVWGPRLRPRDPAADLLREMVATARPQGRDGLRTLRRTWWPEDREVRGQPDGRKAGRRLEGRKAGRRPAKGRPGVGAG